MHRSLPARTKSAGPMEKGDNLHEDDKNPLQFQGHIQAIVSRPVPSVTGDRGIKTTHRSFSDSRFNSTLPIEDGSGTVCQAAVALTIMFLKDCVSGYKWQKFIFRL